MTEKLLLRIDKKNGGISFITPKGKLLSESASMPRQIENSAKSQTWTYFDWSKKEVLKARGTTDKRWTDLKSTAKYISLSERPGRPACIMSNSGYQIFIPGGRRTMCCPTRRSSDLYSLLHVYTEGEKQIDYFFKVEC